MFVCLSVLNIILIYDITLQVWPTIGYVEQYSPISPTFWWPFVIGHCIAFSAVCRIETKPPTGTISARPGTDIRTTSSIILGQRACTSRIRVDLLDQTAISFRGQYWPYLFLVDRCHFPAETSPSQPKRMGLISCISIDISIYDLFMFVFSVFETCFFRTWMKLNEMEWNANKLNIQWIWKDMKLSFDLIWFEFEIHSIHSM